MAEMNLEPGQSITGKNLIFLYDWKRNDVWLYLKENKVDIPIYTCGSIRRGCARTTAHLPILLVDCVSSLIRRPNTSGVVGRIFAARAKCLYGCALLDTELFRRSRGPGVK